MTPQESYPPQVVLLVGGLGSRLRSVLNTDTPKALAQIEGHPFLWYLLRYLSEQQVSNIVLATAHLSDSIRAETESYMPAGMEARFSYESNPRGTGGAMVEALGHVDTDPFIAMNGDSFVHAPLRDLFADHWRSGAVATIALAQVSNSGRFGTVSVDDAGGITAFNEKTGRENPGWINAGIYVLSKAALEPVRDMDVSSIEREVFPYWVGGGLRGFKVESPFIDIGLPETYRAAGQFFRERGYL